MEELSQVEIKETQQDATWDQEKDISGENGKISA